jgi:hypothetical protein
LGIYRGIWVLVYVLPRCWDRIGVLPVISRHQWQVAIINTDRGIELALAVVLVVFVLFAHYTIEMGPQTALGNRICSFGFSVLNNTLLERWL